MSSTNPDKPHILLVDCNQFFVSCEQVFNPALRNKPVVVLSNNDGCVVARSKEAKLLGIPMGAPAFQYKAFFAQKKVYVLSSNFALYGDMSRRVMHVLSLFSTHVEEYSIDEAFLTLSSSNPVLDAEEIKKMVLRWTGISVSIGIGYTKTLAKVASDIAKKTPSGIFAFTDKEQINKVLGVLPSVEIWGIGSHLSRRLEECGIYRARHLMEAPDGWLRKHFSVSILRIAWELRGISCLPLQEAGTPRQSITCSRSFGAPVTALESLEEALACYTANAAEKLREDKTLASFLTVFLMTSAFQASPYSNHITLSLVEPSNYTPLLITTAKEGLRTIFKEGYAYKKVGITLGKTVSETCYQPDLFGLPIATRQKQITAMQVLDRINRRKTKIRFAAEGIEQPWKMKSDQCSNRFTTKWDEILTI